MKPSDALAYRRILLEDMDQIISLQDQALGPDATVYDMVDIIDRYADRFAPSSRITPEDILATALMYRTAREVLPIAQVYYVSEDMTAVARTAAKTMPDQPLLLTDLPSEEGFIIWDAPISWYDDDLGGRTPVTGVIWCTEVDTVYLYPLVRDPNRNALLVHSLTHYKPGEVPAGSAEPDPTGCLRPVLATWALMQQTIATTTSEPANRLERRRAARHELPSDIVVVRLRRLSTSTEHETEETAVEWTHRWLVGGHWRNQWLPSQQNHRLQWIAPYVKGPANLPLVVKERVTAWIR